MDYKFKKENFGSNEFDYYGVDLDSIKEEKEYQLSGLDWWGWTSKEVQMIIDKSNALAVDQEYEYEVEGSGFFMSIKKSEILMWGRGSKTPDVTWSFDEFIEFMEAFKVFVEENS